MKKTVVEFNKRSSDTEILTDGKLHIPDQVTDD